MTSQNTTEYRVDKLEDMQETLLHKLDAFIDAHHTHEVDFSIRITRLEEKQAFLLKLIGGALASTPAWLVLYHLMLGTG